MADDKNNSRILIVVAVIALTGTLGAALIANWDKLFSSQPPSGLPADEARREAEKITTQWVEARLTGDVKTLVKLSSLPFFLDGEILISDDDKWARYQAIAQEKGAGRFSVDRIMSGSIAEYKRLGYVTVNDPLLSRMQLTEDDLVVILIVSTETLKEERIWFYYRRLGDRIEMAGFWD